MDRETASTVRPSVDLHGLSSSTVRGTARHFGAADGTNVRPFPTCVSQAGRSGPEPGVRQALHGPRRDQRCQRRPRRISQLLPLRGLLPGLAGGNASTACFEQRPRIAEPGIPVRIAEHSRWPGPGLELTLAIFVRAQRERISPAALGSRNSAGGWAGGALARVAAVAAVGELLLAGGRARRTPAERARNLHLRERVVV